MDRRRSAHRDILRAEARGIDRTTASNLVAYQAGIPPMPSGWTPHAIEALVFLRRLVNSGRLRP